MLKAKAPETTPPAEPKAPAAEETPVVEEKKTLNLKPKVEWTPTVAPPTPEPATPEASTEADEEKEKEAPGLLLKPAPMPMDDAEEDLPPPLPSRDGPEEKDPKGSGKRTLIAAVL